ncbi:alpha/beta hydrolase [Microbacterium sp. C5A9]|uniref:alpha/beta hydrolase n=1 Tax=Microbacterium sp. C5A9 TaxID=2736663 RepID=UPI001F521634|nr:alpha/beta hydrolase [Microbacterium sp. C5A9]MCI1018180.1 alpha/beta hydrolase [Microbacterium sp. C5A9]
MRRSLRRALLVAGAVGTVLAVGLATTTVVNAVSTETEKDRIVSYGRLVTVDDRSMNVVITGEGDRDVVLLPGFGTASPALDFAPLVAELAEDHRVIVVEPFGYGLSDGTDRPRTTDNIVDEVHAALQSLDVDRYVLMGHSIAGLYAIEYANRYPDEVTAFVGIDTSVPGQPNMDTIFPTGLLAAAKNLGLIRLVASVTGDDLDGLDYDDATREQMSLLSSRNALAPTYLDEMSHIRTNFADAAGTGFPARLPLLLFVVADNAVNPDWIDLHERQASAVDDGTVVPLDGEHYLHHTRSAEIADGFRLWEADRPLGDG